MPGGQKQRIALARAIIKVRYCTLNTFPIFVYVTSFVEPIIKFLDFIQEQSESTMVKL